MLHIVTHRSSSKHSQMLVEFLHIFLAMQETDVYSTEILSACCRIFIAQGARYQTPPLSRTSALILNHDTQQNIVIRYNSVNEYLMCPVLPQNNWDWSLPNIVKRYKVYIWQRVDFHETLTLCLQCNIDFWCKKKIQQDRHLHQSRSCRLFLSGKYREQKNCLFNFYQWEMELHSDVKWDMLKWERSTMVSIPFYRFIDGQSLK